MSLSNRIIGLFCGLLTSTAFAWDASIDALYWRATESFDWVMINDRNVPNQDVTYKTANFQFEPGFRLSIGSEGSWDTTLSYTRYHTHMDASAAGKLTPTLLASKMAQPSIGYFFKTGQIEFSIDYHVIDADFAKTFEWDNRVIVRPLVGIRGAWIDQTIDTSLQGDISVTENLKNNFKAIGPKTGVNTQYTFYQCHATQLQIFADFAMAYLWGNWSIKDVLIDSNNRTIVINNNSRNQGSLGFETAIGLNYVYQNLSLKLGFEMIDWLNQFQIFDDGTGGHSNDLVLQGFTLGFNYQF